MDNAGSGGSLQLNTFTAEVKLHGDLYVSDVMVVKERETMSPHVSFGW